MKIFPAIDIRNKSKSNANAIFRLLSIFTPFFSPVITEITASAVIPAMIRICAFMLFSISNKKCNPAETCCAPNPKDVARPKIVANTASISIKCPGQPHILSFKIGKKAERIVSGSFLLYEKNIDSYIPFFKFFLLY